MSFIKPITVKDLTSTKRANEVTFLSKVLSAILFVMLPFIGFAVGFTTAGGNLGF